MNRNKEKDFNELKELIHKWCVKNDVRVYELVGLLEIIKFDYLIQAKNIDEGRNHD